MRATAKTVIQIIRLSNQMDFIFDWIALFWSGRSECMDEKLDGGGMLWIPTDMVLAMKHRGHSTIRHKSTQRLKSLHIFLPQIHHLTCQNHHSMITQTI